MIILRVAMGHGFLKETVKEINTTLVFANPATVNENCREVHMTIYEIEGSICGPRTPTASSGTSVNDHVGSFGDAY
jgi:hypothetical protein